MKEIQLYEAIEYFKRRTKAGIPVKLIHITFGGRGNSTSKVRVVDHALYRAALPEKYNKSDVLINYTDEDALGNKYRSFYLPLIISIDDLKVVAK